MIWRQVGGQRSGRRFSAPALTLDVGERVAGCAPRTVSPRRRAGKVVPIPILYRCSRRLIRVGNHGRMSAAVHVFAARKDLDARDNQEVAW
jgi:hypothetical protein